MKHICILAVIAALGFPFVPAFAEEPAAAAPAAAPTVLPTTPVEAPAETPPADVKAEDPKPVEKVEEQKSPETKPDEQKTAEQKSDDAPKADSKAEKLAKANQARADKIHESLKAIEAKIKPDEAKHLYLLYNNYTLLGTVKVVRGDVKNAVAACGKENPDLKDAIDKRFATWDAAVSASIKDADTHIADMIAAQDYAPRDDLREIFKDIDRLRADTNKQIDRMPVTTPEACTFLKDKMDDTQSTLTRLLNSTLVSVGRAFPEGEPAAADAKPEDKPADKPAERSGDKPKTE